MLLNKGYVRFGIKCMFEGLSEHGNNSTENPETARSPSLPKLTLPEKCESLLRKLCCLRVYLGNVG